MKEFKLNIFTCCNGVYKEFIPIFILSNLYFNEDTFVEIGVDNDDVSSLESIEFLRNHFSNRFLIRTVNFEYYKTNNNSYKPTPNLIRFLNQPLIKTEYVYISDIDIITMEKNIFNKHIDNIVKNNLLFSNIVRNNEVDVNKKRLTGLHFTKYENYYPILDYSDLFNEGLYSHDELFLYRLMVNRFGNFDETSTYRPVHGIHVSPNRSPEGDIHWGIKNWRNQWVEFRNSKIFLEIEPMFGEYLKDKIKLIDEDILKWE